MKRTKQILESFTPKQTLSSQAIVDIVRELVDEIEALKKHIVPGKPQVQPSTRLTNYSI